MDFYKVVFLIAIAPWLLIFLGSLLPANGQDDAAGEGMLEGIVMLIAFAIDAVCILAALIKWLF